MNIMIKSVVGYIQPSSSSDHRHSDGAAENSAKSEQSECGSAYSNGHFTNRPKFKNCLTSNNDKCDVTTISSAVKQPKDIANTS